jgi:hypothetical protein
MNKKLMAWISKMSENKTSQYKRNRLIVGSTQEPNNNLIVPITTSSNKLLLPCKLMNLN